MSRNVLAELAYDHQDMEGIYQNYAYFKYLNRKDEYAGQYNDLCNRLITRYDSLLIEDSKNPISNGLYAAAIPSDKYGSYAIIQIYNNGNFWNSSMIGGESLYQEKEIKKSEPQIPQIVLQSEPDENGEDTRYSVVWNKHSQRNPNESLAKSAAKSGNDFARNMTGELASGRYSTGEVLAGTALTAVGRGIFTGIASLASYGSSSFYSTELVWNPISGNGGALDATMIISKVSQNTNQSKTETEKSDIPLKLYKLYPHTAALFIDPKSKQIFFPGKITSHNLKKDAELQWQLTAHPIIFDEEVAQALGINGKIDLNLMKKNKSFHQLMFNLFVRNAAFPHFSSDPVAARFAPIGECIADYSYGQIVYKKRDGTGPTAIIDRDGTEIYQDFPKEGSVEGPNFVNAYHLNGFQYSSKWDDGDSRTAHIEYPDGRIYTGEVRYFSPEGKGSLAYADGRVSEGIFDSGNLFEGVCTVPTEKAITILTYKYFEADTIATVNFNNGDVYVGPIDSNYLPHGKGKFTAKGKKTRMTDWEAGQLLPEKNTNRKRAGKRSPKNRKSTRR